MSQIKKKYLDILKQIDEEHNSFGDLHRNSKTLVIDGLNTFIRSWSTAPNLNDNGDHIGGIVGTLKSIGYAIRIINPTRVIVVFDGKGGANSRKEITQLRQDGEKVVLMSSDKDFLQLVNKDVSVYSPSKKKIYNIDEVIEEYGIHPHNFINFRMIDGDKSDNVSGISGLGLKTIIKSFPLLTEAETHTTDSMVEYVNSLPKKTKAHELFLDNLAICERNRKLMQLSEPIFSGNIRMKIMDRYNEPTTKFDKQTFLKYGLKSGVIDAFKDINDWLKSTFSHIARF